jgi:predicted transcriptional regulator
MIKIPTLYTPLYTSLTMNGWSLLEAMTYGIIDRKTLYEAYEVQPTSLGISRHLNVSQRQVQRALDKLVAAGKIEKMPDTSTQLGRYFYAPIRQPQVLGADSDGTILTEEWLEENNRLIAEMKNTSTGPIQGPVSISTT